MSELPSTFYWTIGVLVVFNLGTIATVITAIVKLTWFLSRLDNRVEQIEGSHGKDIDQAFQKIRDLEKGLILNRKTND